MLITPLEEIVIPSPAVNLSYLFYKVLLIVVRVLLIVSIFKVLDPTTPKVFFNTLSNVVIPKIPVVYSTLLMFSGQMLCAIIIDAIVMGDFSWQKLLGAIIVVLGIFYNSKVDEKEANKLEKEKIKKAS